MITRQQVKDPKKRILMVCVQMFIERGFKATTMMDIIHAADVSSGTFQNIFRTKDGVLYELVRFMFDNQFAMARTTVGGDENVNPVVVYAVETALQIAITELNENLREIYVEAYTQPTLAECIYQRTSTELARLFGRFNPDWSESDFYEAEIGSAGMMRAYMARPCDKYFTLRKKIERFLQMSLDMYHVPQEMQQSIFATLSGIDFVDMANSVMKKLFAMLEMTFEFKFENA